MKSDADRIGYYTQIFDDDPEQLSGGERNIKQLRALCESDAEILFLDEPSSHLDTYAQIALEKAIKEYKGTVLMVTHDFYTVANCADRILLLENGTVREQSGRAYRKSIYKKYFESDIFDTVAEIENNPCYLCARMRRGYLYSHAKELGCNKIALGHHFDDVIETILMGMLYSGKVETMMPKLHSQNFEGMELIRPMYLIKESAIKAWRDTNGLHFIQCACRFTENCVSCGGGRGSKRDEMKELVAQFRNTSSVIETNIFNSVRDINLRTVMGYHKDGEYYNFLDDYDQRGNKGADKEKE